MSKEKSPVKKKIPKRIYTLVYSVEDGIMDAEREFAKLNKIKFTKDHEAMMIRAMREYYCQLFIRTKKKQYSPPKK